MYPKSSSIPVAGLSGGKAKGQLIKWFVRQTYYYQNLHISSAVRYQLCRLNFVVIKLTPVNPFLSNCYKKLKQNKNSDLY
jgi:hypothetical protein